MYQANYYDEQGIPRVYGMGQTIDEAIGEAQFVLAEYRRARPDKQRAQFTLRVFMDRPGTTNTIGPIEQSYETA